MYKLAMLLLGAAALSTPLSAQLANDSIAARMEKELELNEVVVVARRPVLKQEPDRIVYLTKNDPYAVGLDALQLLDRVPRISVINDLVSVAGKSSVKYIVDGRLLEMPEDAIAVKLRNLQAAGIEKIELLTTPPAKYAASGNVAYISITTRNESLGTRGNLRGSGGVSDYFRYSAGGALSHTTRRVELSADAGWDEYKGRNDIYKEYRFAGYSRISDRSNIFKQRTFGLNGLFKYKFDEALSAGAIVNFSTRGMKSDISDRTDDGPSTMLSTSRFPYSPENALTLTGFADWKLGSDGKMLSLTYNWFDKRNRSSSDVTTAWSDLSAIECLTKDADDRYSIHSVKLDAALPFSFLRMDAGAAFTAIGNNTDLQVATVNNGIAFNDPTQSNHFIYNEKTAAAYVSAEKSFSRLFFAKLALRYEHTSLRGLQEADGAVNTRSYGHLFPTVNLSWNLPGAGRLSADYSMGINRPNFGDLNPFRYYNTVKDYFTGNPDLESVIVHNAGVNYSFNGFYAVLYGSWERNAVGYVTRFGADGMQWITPENCLNTLKTGLYASYNRSLTGWWNLNAGAEVFYAASRSRIDDFRDSSDGSWSGKLEINTSWMLNPQKSLIFNVRCAHYFPTHDKMTRISSRTLFNCDLRYMLLDNRLTLSASVNDPFGWTATRSRSDFRDYTLYSRTDIHAHSLTLRIAYTFGGTKVNSPYRDTKERESRRSY